MDLLRSMRFAPRLAALIGIFALGFVVYGVWSLRTLYELKVNGPLYQEISRGKDLIADVLPPPLYIIESYLVVQQLAAADNAIDRDELTQRLRTLHAQQMERQHFWEGKPLDPILAGVLRQCNVHASAFYTAAFGTLVPALTHQDRALAAHAMLDLKRHYELHRRVVDNLVTLAGSRARYTEQQGAERVETATVALLMILAGTLSVGIVGAMLISRSITGPLDAALAVARRVTAGDLSISPSGPWQDEPGMLLNALNEMKRSLAATAAARTESEAAMRRARDLADHLIECASVLVIGLGRQGEVLIFNETAAEVTGCLAENIIGRIWRDLPLLPMSAAALWPSGGHAEQLARMPPCSEHAILTPSGDERRIAWRHTLITEGNVGLLSFGVDVTEQRQAEQAMRAARELADGATRSKSAFVASMSHEIRTPINAIIGLTQLALKTELNERQRDYLQQSASAAHNLLSLVDDILQFARIETGRLHVEECVFQLRAVLDLVVAEQQALARDREAALQYAVADDVPTELLGDALHLQQLLHTLLGSALRCSEGSAVTLSVQRSGADATSTLLRFAILAPLACDNAPALFDPDVQAGSAGGRQGLGLAIARQLSALLGGHLTLESEPGVGNRLIFTARFQHVPALSQPATAQAGGRPR